MELNKKHSHQNYANISLKHLPAEEFNNTIIRNTTFCHEVCTDTVTQIDTLPTNIINVTFEYCNLINVYIPPTCVVGEFCDIGKELSSGQGILKVNDDPKRSKDPVIRLTKAEYIKAHDNYKKGPK